VIYVMTSCTMSLIHIWFKDHRILRLVFYSWIKKIKKKLVGITIYMPPPMIYLLCYFWFFNTCLQLFVSFNSLINFLFSSLGFCCCNNKKKANLSLERTDASWLPQQCVKPRPSNVNWCQQLASYWKVQVGYQKWNQDFIIVIQNFIDLW
jgi:hypothetical protein